jgi:hypothetical protein
MLGCHIGCCFQATIDSGSYQDGLTAVVQGHPPGMLITKQDIYDELLLRKPWADELSSPGLNRICQLFSVESTLPIQLRALTTQSGQMVRHSLSSFPIQTDTLFTSNSTRIRIGPHGMATAPMPRLSSTEQPTKPSAPAFSVDDTPPLLWRPAQRAERDC